VVRLLLGLLRHRQRLRSAVVMSTRATSSTGRPLPV
jgi:hypothetical protein